MVGEGKEGVEMPDQLEEIDLIRLGPSKFQEMCQFLLEAEYGGQFVSNVRDYWGDANIDGFLKDGTIFQCKCYEKLNYGLAKPKIKKAVTEELKAIFEDVEKRERIIGSKIEKWILIIPYKYENDLISFLDDQKQKYSIEIECWGFVKLANLLLKLSEIREQYFPREVLNIVTDIKEDITELKTTVQQAPTLPTKEDLESVLKPITKETLQQAQKDAQERLADLKACQGEEYVKLCNEEALIGCLPEWHHLYMGSYGAFARPEKEKQVLLEIDKNIKKLADKSHGLLLHVISGSPGRGKSTLVNLVIRRLIENQDLKDFPRLSEALTSLNIFYIRVCKAKDWETLEHAASEFIQADKEKSSYLLYFDDLFVLKDEEVDRLLGVFNKVSDRVPIYFLATSPSWVLDRRDLQEKKSTFQLVACINTEIEGLEEEDRKELKLQYQEMYGEQCQPDLFKLIDSKEEDLILLKLALHHNLTYSEYLNRLFQNLEGKKPRYLAALILFSTVARFYVHFPLPLIQEFNRELRKEDRLWESSGDYQNISDLGFRLFRVRTGTSSERNPSGTPDTIAPFHDRVAQVIYDTWGERKKVPVFNCDLWELRNKVYSKLFESDKTRPLLANVFRGQLQVASSQELFLFVRSFGPVQQNKWMLLDEPDAAYRWITYSSKYRTDQTKDLRKYWSQILKQTIQRKHGDPKVHLVLSLLNPHETTHFEDQEWISALSELEEKYFFILNGVLNELLNQQPLPMELLSKYLAQMNDWLNKYQPSGRWSLSYRYLVIASLTRIRTRKLCLQKQLNHALAQIVKGYLVNISDEYVTNDVLGIWGLKTLIKKIEWMKQDSTEISESLVKYIQNEEKKYQPILFELLLIFIRFGNLRIPSADELFSLYYRICIQNSGFYGLTYTSQDFWEHLKALNSIDPTEYRQLLENIVESLSSGRLDDFMKSTAYPDFLDGLMKHLVFMRYRIGAGELLNLLRPLVANFNDSQPARYIFWGIKKLSCPDIQSIHDLVGDDINRQIRLCLAEKINLPLELTLKDFVELLERERLLFSIELDFPRGLDNGTSILEGLRREFKNNGISLSQGATLIEENDSISLIADKNNKQTYTIRKEEGKLNIYKDGITIPSALSVLLTDYLKTKRTEELSTPLLEEYKKRIYTWLWRRIDTNEAVLFFPSICADVLFYPEEAKGLEALAALTIQNDIPDEYFPFSYFSWWLKEEVDLTHSEQKYVLLDAFWDYSLRHSHLGKDDKFVIYERYLLYLLDNYPINRDEIWWGQAVKRLITYYNELIVRSRTSKPRQIKWKRKMVDKVTMLYKQRICLDQMMETILGSYSLVESRLEGIFKRIVEEAFADYEDQTWVIKWRFRLGLEVRDDVTKLFLDDLNSIEGQPVSIFDIRNQANWWLEWIRSSKQHPATELTKVWQWLDKTRPPRVSIFLLPILFKFFPNHLANFESGLLVKNVIEKVGVEFRDKSILIKSYMEFLRILDSTSQNEILNREVEELREILSWFLKEVKNKTDTLSAVYGLQLLFDSALKYKLDFELVKVEEVFFRILEAQIDHPEGGELCKHYFPWLLNQREQINIARYLGWIETNYQKRQTPYVFKHLIESLLKSTHDYEVRPNELDMTWGIFKLLISKRLDSEGTTGVTPDFFQYFIQIQRESSDDKNKLNNVSEEFYDLCVQMSDHDRVIYLLINFFPVWQQLSEKPSPQEMLLLWQKMLSTGFKKIEPLGRLARQMNNYLQERKETELLSEFDNDLISFIEGNPSHILSPKFAKILIQKKSYLREVSTLLPKLVRYQKNMEDLRYTVAEYFQCNSKILDEKELIEFEASLIEALESNLSKPFSDRCVSLVIKECTPEVHYERITQFIETYLKAGRKSEDFWQVLEAYHTYEGKSNIEEIVQKDTIESFLSIIRSNAQRVQAARYFSAILSTWEADFIPQESAIDTLRHLILQTSPSRWRRIRKVCQNFRNLFRPDVLLSSTMSIGTALNQLGRHKEVSLISIKQQLAAEDIQQHKGQNTRESLTRLCSCQVKSK